MARLNFEDDIFSDPRFHRMCAILGDMEKALGKLARLWFLAQKHWKDEQRLIPFEEFESDDFAVCVQVGLVRKRETGYYAAGSEERFAWLIQKAAAGKKSAEARLSKYGSNQPVKPRTAIEHRSESVERSPNTPEPPTPTPTHISDTTYPHPTGSRDKTITLDKIWNEHCGNLPKVKELNKQRQAAIKARLKENSNEEYWIDVAKAIASNPFCNGDNKSGWIANFDFFIKPGTHLKAAEGSYMPKRANPEKKPIVFSESLRS